MEPLNKSFVGRVAGEIGMARVTLRQYSNTVKQAVAAPDFAATLTEWRFAGGLLCQACTEGSHH